MSRLSLFAAALASLLVLALAAAQPAKALPDCDVPPSAVDDAEREFLELINAYRAEYGLSQLTISANLTRAADWTANDMGQNGYFGHTDTLGRGPWERTVACGYPIAGGENLAAGTNRDSAASAFELFRNSPTHNSNMLLPAYQQIGISRSFHPGSRYGWYWATEFGTTDDGTGAPTAVAPPPPPEPVAFTEPAPPPLRPTEPDPEVAVRPDPDSAGAVQRTGRLSAGLNVLEWKGSDVSLSDYPAAIAGVSTIYAFDEPTGEWRRSSSGLPGFANNLAVLRAGETYWLIAERDVTLGVQP